jgi:hypothetical protein
MLPAAFEPTIPASERPQTHALVRKAVDIASCLTYKRKRKPAFNEIQPAGVCYFLYIFCSELCFVCEEMMLPQLM